MARNLRPSSLVRLSVLFGAMTLLACTTPVTTTPDDDTSSSTKTKKSTNGKAPSSPVATGTTDTRGAAATASPTTNPNATKSPTASPTTSSTPTPSVTATPTPTPIPTATAATPLPTPAGTPGTVDTYAGSTTYDGAKFTPTTNTIDNADPKLAKFKQPKAVVLGADGLVYVADSGNHAIRKIAANGAVTTVLGTGEATTRIDPKTLNTPLGLAVKADGTIYIADTGNNRIRKLSPGATGLDFVAGNGDIGYVDDKENDEARFGLLTDIVLNEAGDVAYVADQGNFCIRKIALKTDHNLVTTLAGSNTADYVDATTGAAARFSKPNRLYRVGTDLYVTDGLKIRKVDTNTGATTTVKTLEREPTGIAVDGTKLYFVSSENRSLYRLTLPDGTPTLLIGQTEVGKVDGPDGKASFGNEGPLGMTRLANGTLLLADTANSLIRRYYPLAD